MTLCSRNSNPHRLHLKGSCSGCTWRMWPGRLLWLNLQLQNGHAVCQVHRKLELTLQGHVVGVAGGECSVDEMRMRKQLCARLLTASSYRSSRRRQTSDLGASELTHERGPTASPTRVLLGQRHMFPGMGSSNLEGRHACSQVGAGQQ